jgi:hypothetical protein
MGKDRRFNKNVEVPCPKCCVIVETVAGTRVQVCMSCTQPFTLHEVETQASSVKQAKKER